MFRTNGTQVHCTQCGLTMTNGFCLHGSAAQVLASAAQVLAATEAKRHA